MRVGVSGTVPVRYVRCALCAIRHPEVLGTCVPDLICEHPAGGGRGCEDVPRRRPHSPVSSL